MRVKVLFKNWLDCGALMQKSYRVSVRYKSGPLEGKFVVQVVNVLYNIGRELCEIWTEKGFEVLIIPMDVRKPNLRQLWRYKLRNRKKETKSK